MSEEGFFHDFSQELVSSLVGLRERIWQPVDWTKPIYEKVIIPCPDSKGGVTIAACDGSAHRVPFTGNIEVWYARALARLWVGGSIEDHRLTRIYTGPRRMYDDAFAKAVELDALAKAISHVGKVRRPFIAFYDGALYPSIPFHRPGLEGKADLYEAHVKALNQLLRKAKELGVSLVGVSKDSVVNYLRIKLLKDCLKLESPKLHAVVARERNLARMVKRLKIVLKSSADGDCRIAERYLRELEAVVSDEEVFGHIIKEPGFTKPLLLAPNAIYTSGEIEARRASWQESFARERMLSDEELRPLAEALDELYSLPPIALMYWKPHHGLGVYRLDLPAHLLNTTTVMRQMNGDEWLDGDLQATKDIVSSLNAVSPHPHGPYPLLYVDELVRLTSAKREAYEARILVELQRLGIKARLRKRRLRDLLLRRGPSP